MARWDDVTQLVYTNFKESQRMIDTCALKIAHEIEFNNQTDWPAYCNDFEQTISVQSRVFFLRDLISQGNYSDEELANLKRGSIWIGAGEDEIILSWGTPEEKNTTITANNTRIQWVYTQGNYIYTDNGIVTSIQN